MTDIKKEIGQVWETKSGREIKIIGFTSKDYTVAESLESNKVYSWNPNNEIGDIFHKLISGPGFVKPEPEYKRFEINWSFDWPTCGGHVVDNGIRIDGYRIYGFGDKDLANPLTWSPVPSSRYGNYKYAYGRLER